MNKRIKELAQEADLYVDVNGQPWPRNMNGEDIEGAYQKFAELIIRECRVALNPMLRDMVSRGQAFELIKKHFVVEESRGWVCSKCGVDRTREVCPKGHTAALTGECPMIAVAQ